jgi:hypothetical protein
MFVSTPFAKKFPFGPIVTGISAMPPPVGPVGPMTGPIFRQAFVPGSKL